MSFVHWNKSVLSFHLKEIIEDGSGNHPLALIGLSAIALGPIAVSAATKLGRPLAKAAIKSYLSLSEQQKTPITRTSVSDRGSSLEGRDRKPLTYPQKMRVVGVAGVIAKKDAALKRTSD